MTTSRRRFFIYWEIKQQQVDVSYLLEKSKNIFMLNLWAKEVELQ